MEPVGQTGNKMNEQLKESLSAVIDDEADEFEIRRVLNEAAGDPELRGVWERYHLVRSVMRGEGLVVDRSISRFWSQVDDDQTAPEEIVEAAEAVAAPVHKPWAGWFGRGAGLAAVAGIVVALIVGIGGGE
jgi:sigma-E factor negative regulatory protein RseA